MMMEEEEEDECIAEFDVCLNGDLANSI